MTARNLEFRRPAPWQPIKELPDWDVITVEERLNSLTQDGQPFLAGAVAEYHQLATAMTHRQPENAALIRKKLLDQFAGSIFEHLTADLLEKKTDTQTYEYLSPYKTAEWCKAFTIGQEIITHPFHTYSLRDKSLVFDGLIQPRVRGTGPIICVEITTHVTSEYMQAKVSQFEQFQRRFGDTLPPLSLQFFVPIIREKDELLDLYLPEPGMIAEVPISGAALYAIIDKHLPPISTTSPGNRS